MPACCDNRRGIGDIHFDRNTITTQNRKAGKAMAERPIPEEVMTELSNYVATLQDGQERLFVDRFSPKLWRKAWKAAGLPKVKFHDLRKTFASLLAPRRACRLPLPRGSWSTPLHSSPMTCTPTSIRPASGHQPTAPGGLGVIRSAHLRSSPCPRALSGVRAIWCRWASGRAWRRAKRTGKGLRIAIEAQANG